MLGEKSSELGRTCFHGYSGCHSTKYASRAHFGACKGRGREALQDKYFLLYKKEAKELKSKQTENRKCLQHTRHARRPFFFCLVVALFFLFRQSRVAQANTIFSLQSRMVLNSRCPFISQGCIITSHSVHAGDGALRKIGKTSNPVTSHLSFKEMALNTWARLTNTQLYR